MNTCLNCGEPAVRKFCSGVCKQRAYRARLKKKFMLSLDDLVDNVNWYLKNENVTILSAPNMVSVLIALFGEQDRYEARKLPDGTWKLALAPSTPIEP